MLPWSYEFAGRIDEHVVDSELLRGNPLDDPYERPLWVYVPPTYDDDTERRYPTVYVLQGYTGHLTVELHLPDPGGLLKLHGAGGTPVLRADLHRGPPHRHFPDDAARHDGTALGSPCGWIGVGGAGPNLIGQRAD